MAQYTQKTKMSLHCLSYSGNIELITSLQLSRSELNETDENGCTALHLACYNNHTNVIKYLIHSGANIECQDNNLTTPLHWCAYNGNKEMVELLIDKGSGQLEDANGIQPMHLAALIGRKEILQILLSQKNINFKDNSGATPLHLAAYCGHNDCIQVILDAGCIDINERDKNEITPIYLATMSNLLDTANLLLKNGVHRSACNDAMCWAVINGNLELLKIFLTNAGSLTNCNYEYSLLFLATMYGHDQVILYLLEKGSVIQLVDGSAENYIRLTNIDGPDGIVFRNLHVLKSLSTSLYWASAYCSGSAIEALINSDINPNQLESFNNERVSPLHVAASFGNCDAIEVLLDKGLDVNMNIDESTPLEWAVAHGHLNSVKILLERGANMNQALCWAAVQGYTDIAKILLENGVDLNEDDQDDEYPRTPLIAAASCGQGEMVKFLLDNGADINSDDLLHWCAFNDLIDTIKLVLDRGVDVNSSDLCFNRSALHWAALEGHMNTAKLLIGAGIEVNAVEDQGDLAIHYAVNHNHPEMVKLLIANGSKLNKRGDIGRPLCLAARCGYFEIVQILVEAGADINLAEFDVDTPLNLAMSNKHLDIVKYLVEKGADKTSLIHEAAENCTLDELKETLKLGCNIHAVDNSGRSALSSAARGNLENTQFLIESGLDVNFRDNYGETPIYQAIISENIDIIKLLIKHGANLNIQTYSHGNVTPLISAVNRYKLEIVQLLVENGADPNMSDGNGQTPLHHARGTCALEIMTYLLSRNVNVNTCDVNGNTPLHDTAMFGDNVESVELLLRHGADVNAIGAENLTPLSKAIRRKFYTAVKLLLLYGADLHLDKNILKPCTEENDLKFIKLLHLAGLRLSKIDNPLGDVNQNELCYSIKNYLIKMEHEPLTMKQLSRIACRYAFGKHYHNIINKNYFPQSLKSYLAFNILD